MKTLWSHTISNNPNDCNIIVMGTENHEAAILAAKELFKKDVTDINGCIAQTWGAWSYPSEEPNTVYVSMRNVG